MELPKFYVGGYFGAGDDDFSPERRQSEQQKPVAAEHFTIDDLLDFSNADALDTDGFFDTVAGNSTVTAVDSCNSSVSGGEPQFSGNQSFGHDSQFSGDLCVPIDDVAELEWVSNFLEDSILAEKDLQALHFLSTTTAAIAKPQTPETTSSSSETPPQNAPLFHHDTPLPGKARSKRSRAAPGDWTTRLLHLITPTNDDGTATKPPKTASSKKRDGSSSNSGSDSSGRKCLHCASEKTPQWRTGPMGPKTLCNACGVRYKSGRLVPEYRPAASPTFVSASHSNSHRKVLELRRQKDLHRSHQHQYLSQSSIFGVSNGGDEQYLIHHHSAPDFRQLM